MDFSGKKIMICDDSVLARRKLRDSLLELGVSEVIEAADGDACISQYKANKPDLVFMDIVMPKKDGVQAVADIIAIDPDAKIVMASSVGTQEYLKDALKAGACDFIQKPLEKETMIEAMKKALSGGN